MSNGTKLRGTLLVGIFLLVVAALGISRFDSYFRQPMLEEGDAAVNALQIDNAKHLTEIYGNYSRFEFHHPGPAFFYVYAGAEWLLHDVLHVAPSPQNAHLFACLVLQALFFALALTVFYSHFPHRAWLTLAVAAGGLYFAYLDDAFISIWPPNQLLMPFLCFLIAAISVGTGRLQHLPIAGIAGGFLFHGHVAQPLFVGGLGALALGLGYRQARRDTGLTWRGLGRLHRAPIAITAGIGVIFVFPLMIDVVTRGTSSNVATILGRFAYNTDEANSAYKAFLYFISFATDSRDQEHLFTHVGPELYAFLRANAWRIAAWMVAFIAPTGIAYLRRNRLPGGERRFLLTAGGFLAATVALCVLWGKAQAGAMYNFNGIFYYGIYYFALLLVFAAVAPFLDRLSPAPVGVVLAVGAVGFLGWKERTTGLSDIGPSFEHGLNAALAADPDPRPKLLVFEHADWPHVSTLALMLQRRGIDYYTMPWWTFMFEQRHSLSRLGDHPEQKADVWWITRPAPGGNDLDPELSIFTKPAAIQPGGGEINLAGHAGGFRYVVYGISAGNLDCATTELPRVLFRFETPPTHRDVRLTVDAQPVDLSSRRVATEIYLDGVLVGRMQFEKHTDIAVTIPAALWNSQPVADLELRMPGALPQRRLRRPDHTWWAGLQIYKLKFGPADAAPRVAVNQAAKP